jgi:chromosome segregation ATPase
MLSITITGTAKSTKRRTPTREIESTVVTVRVWLGSSPAGSAEITEIDPLNATWSATLVASASANPQVLSARATINTATTDLRTGNVISSSTSDLPAQTRSIRVNDCRPLTDQIVHMQRSLQELTDRRAVAIAELARLEEMIDAMSVEIMRLHVEIDEITDHARQVSCL